MEVSLFGDPRIEAYLQLPAAYRSLSRPSSAPCAKAFTLCSCSLELSLLSSSLLLNCLSFIKQIMISVINSSVKRFYPFAFWILFPPFGEIVIYPNWKDLDLFANLLVKSLSSYLFVSYSNYFIRFSMNIFQNNGLRCFEKASFAWWTSSSPCFGKDANLALTRMQNLTLQGANLALTRMQNLTLQGRKPCVH